MKTLLKSYLVVLSIILLFSGCGGGGSSSSSDNTLSNTQVVEDDTTQGNDNLENQEEAENSSNQSDQTSTILYKLVDTGQTLCYDSNTGDEKSCNNSGYDADYQGNQPSYTISSNDLIVTDNVTGLMWTKSSDIDGDGETSDSGDKLSESEAISYCSNLSLGGYDDWRLPDIKTLYSLILFTGEDPSGYSGDSSNIVTFLDSSFSRALGDESSGERVIDGQYATTTRYVSTTMGGETTMFGVNFVDGRIKGYPIVNKDYYVLCVRGNESYGQNNFKDNGNGTISDNATGLMWQQDDTQTTGFEDAISTCEDSNTAGYSNWRVPNIKELQSIIDYTRSPDTTNSAAIDPIFNTTSFTNEEGEIDWGYYWSNTTHASTSNGKSGAYVSFGRALGYMNGSILDVHGAGSQRSNGKNTISNDSSVQTASGANGNFYYKGPQGDILRTDNMVRCVRDDDIISTNTQAVTNNKVSDGYVLFSTIGDKNTYLIDNNGESIKTYSSEYSSSGGSYLSDSYTLLRAGKTQNARNGSFENGGGVGGIIEEIDANNNVIWSYSSDSDLATLHHDFKQIDDNYIVALVWELRNYNGNNYWNDKIIKIDKSSKNIVWEWSAMDDGNILPSSNNADYIHLNSVDYKNGQYLVSSRTQNTLWLIDEDNKNIISSFTANSTLQGQHDATFLDNGNILVFNNKTSDSSSIVEIDTNDNIVWEYSNGFFSDHISGVQRLYNGNSLICSGVEGKFIEVTNDKQVVWEYTNPYINETPKGDSNSVFKIRKYLKYN